MATKTMSAWEARRNFGKVLNEVTRNRRSVIVESHGEPVAAIVPLHVLEQYESGIRRFLAIANKAAANANLSEDEAMDLALREVAAHRAEQRAAEEVARNAGGG